MVPAEMASGLYIQDSPDTPQWVRTGASAGFEDLVFFAGMDRGRSFDEAAASAHVVLTGPHASPAYPEELRGVIDPLLTCREQFDYSDIASDWFAMRWALSDPRVIYIRNPVSRLVFDQNRARDPDPAVSLREIETRIAANAKGASLSFAGLDCIRPVTFAGRRVLMVPDDDAEIESLTRLITDCAGRLSFAYAATRDRVIEAVLEAKLKMLADAGVGTLPASHSRLHVQCIHDTMNAWALPDGAISRMRPPEEQLPRLVSFANRGDLTGEQRHPFEPGMIPREDVLTMPAAELRAVASAFAAGFDLQAEGGQISINTPYLGAHEVQHIARNLRNLGPRLCRPGGIAVRAAACQAEYLRETLLGETATRVITVPGTGWPDPDEAVLSRIVQFAMASIAAMRDGWDAAPSQ